MSPICSNIFVDFSSEVTTNSPFKKKFLPRARIIEKRVSFKQYL